MSLLEHGFDELVSFGTDIIHEAGEKALEFYGKGNSDIKFDDGLITRAELTVTEFFKNSLQSQYPDHQIFRNIHDIHEYSHDETRYLWIFDPLDGAASFQAGIPIWGLSLALIENFWPIFGLVYMPATGDLFQARAGGNAYRGDTDIHVSDQENVNNESLLLTFSRFHLNYKTSFPGKIRNLGCTAAHVCYVAMGRADAAVVANESYQDLAAAQIIIEAAGGKIQKMDGSDFFLNEYLNGQRIEDHLMIASPNIGNEMRTYIEKI
jgi:myo-inositol-1(or 4)-monophosphatase